MSYILGQSGIVLIRSFETCRLVAYQDQRGIWTIGWGHTGPEVVEGLVWTQSQADTVFSKDTMNAVLGVIRSVDVAINQNQFDALVSFTYNVGIGSEGHSTMVKLINQSQFAAAAAQFPLWNHCAGVVDAGLTRRRAAERALFETPV